MAGVEMRAVQLPYNAVDIVPVSEMMLLCSSI